MKKSGVIGIVLILLILVLGIGNWANRKADGGRELPVPEEEPMVTTFDYEGFSDDLTDLIDSYQPVGEGAYASCRLLVSADGSLDISGFGEKAVLSGPGDTYILQFDTPDAAAEAQQKLLSVGVSYAEPDGLVYADEVLSWGTSAMGADTFASSMVGAQTYVPVVAVVDTGVSSHSMLWEFLSGGWDFVDNDADPTDENGHGTHVAGIVADAMGVLRKKIIPVRVLGSEGKGYSSLVGLGIRYAADRGADVINLSLGGDHSSYVEEAVRYARNRDCLVVAAAGNNSTDAYRVCPAHIAGCVTVSALNKNMTLAHFSNFGSSVDFCAPGEGIQSASHTGGYVMKQGTSMAAPYISACAAMGKACGFAQTAQETEAFLQQICLDLGDPGKDTLYGYGMPDMAKAMDALVENRLLDNYWIMGYVSQTEQKLYEMVFDKDGTFTAVDMRDYAPEYGSYYIVGTQIYMTFPTMELQETQFYYEEPAFWTVDYFNWGNERGSYKLTPSDGTCFAMMGLMPETEPVSDWNSDWGPITTLADGTYYITFYVDSFRGDETRTVVTTALLSYVELDEVSIYALRPGTTVQVGGYTLNVEKTEFSEIGTERYLDINDWEYARYLPEIGRWRFYSVDDMPLTYQTSNANLLVPASAQVWDYLTAYGYGQNVYGQQYTGSESADSNFFRLERIEDYYFMHMADYSEEAYVTVQNGTVVRFEIPFHP